MNSPQFQRGALVEYWFDDGLGGSLLYGEVTAAGPKTATVRWESGLVNRIEQGSHLVKAARDQALARAAMDSATERLKARATIAKT